MSLLSVVSNVCLVVGLDVPSVVASSTDREMQEMFALANKMARRLMKVYDWNSLLVLKTFTGDGVSETFAMPTAYDRMPQSMAMWSSRWTWAFNHITDANTWLEYQVVPYTFINGNWMIQGNQFHFLPIMASTETLKMYYVTENIILSSSSVEKRLFTADDDTLRPGIDEDLLELAMVWQWRANKGLPYEQDKQNYDLLLNKRMKDDKGSNPMISGNPQVWYRKGNWAFPGTVGQ